MGDSFTFGLLVNTEENYSSILERSLNNLNCPKRHFEVINLGVMGYDLLFASYRFKIRGEKYQPDLVVWFINDHNFHTIPQLFKKQMEELEKSISREEKEEARKKGNYHLVWNKAEALIENFYMEKSIIEQEHAALYELARHYKGPLILTGYVSSRFKSLMKLFVSNRPSTVLQDNLPDIYGNSGGVYVDGHPSTKGHELIASSLLTFLLTNNFIPCNTGQ